MAKEIDKIIKSTTPPKSKDVLWDNGKELLINRNGKWESTGGVAPMLNVKYAELVELRNNNKLIAGMQYRITDYVTTTAQEDTRSAGHQFDVIVTADNENTLNEVARACLHEGDTYFSEAGANLAAWQIWYSLDNDAERFAWADIENGKGIIYRMIDEWNNDVPYDFKNIQFKRYILEASDAFATDVAKGGELDIVKEKLQEMSHKIHTNVWYYGECISDVYPDANPEIRYVPFGDIEYNNAGPQVFCEIDENNYGWFYTFHNEGEDASLLKHNVDENVGVYDNTIKDSCYIFFVEEGVGSSYPAKSNAQSLNNIVFVGNNCYSNSFGTSCSFNSFSDDCSFNSFGNGCYFNSFGNNCSFNSFSDDCSFNSFGNGCSFNSFGNNCYSNSFGTNCCSNSFGNGCYSNSFGNGCHSNSFGNGCCSNSFSNECGSNSFGEGCCSNSFGNGCYSNSFSNDCSFNSFGNNCYFNSFGNGCCSNSFGNNCYSNSFGNGCCSNSFGNNCYFNSFGNNCSFNSFGIGCSFNSFGNNCYSNSFEDDGEGDSRMPAHNVENCTLEDGVHNLEIWYDDYSENYSAIRYLHFCRGVNNVEIIPAVNLEYEMTYARKSNGDIVNIVLADLKNS